MSNNQQFELLKKSAVTQIADDLQSQFNSAANSLDASVGNKLAQWEADRALTESGDFDTGFTVTERQQVFLYNGEWYRWDGALPKTVAASSTPSSTGGIGAGAWVSVGDAALRSALAAPDSDVLVGGRPAKEITDVATAEAFVRLKMKLMAMGRTVLQATDLVSLTLNDPNVDNTAALEALAKRPTARSEIIEFPSGVIYCDEVSLEDFIYWRGRAGTVFKQVAKHIELSNRITNVFNARQKRGYILENFEIDGNKQNHTVDPSPGVGTANVEGLQTKGSGEFIVANVVSGNTLGDAFDTDDTPITSSGGVFWQCVAKDANKDGFHNSAGSYGNVHIDCVAINCQGVRGGFTQASGSLGGHVFINPTAIGCRFAYGIQATSGEPATLIGAKSYHCDDIGDLSGVGLGQTSVEHIFNIPFEPITPLNATHAATLSDYKVEQLFNESGTDSHIFYVILNELGSYNRIAGEFLLYRRINAATAFDDRARIFIDSVTNANASIASVYIEQDASSSSAGRGWMDFFTADYKGKKHLVARLSRRNDAGGGVAAASYQNLIFKGIRDRLNVDALKTFVDTNELDNLTAIEDDTSVSFTFTDGDAKRTSEAISRLNQPVPKSTSFVDQRGFGLAGQGSVHVDYEVLYDDFSNNITPHIPLCRVVNNAQVKSRTSGVFYTSRTKVTTNTNHDSTVNVDAFWDFAGSRFIVSGFEMGGHSPSEFLIGEIDGDTWLVLRIPGSPRFVAFSGMRNDDGIQGQALTAGDFTSLATIAAASTEVSLQPVRFLTGLQDLTE